MTTYTITSKAGMPPFSTTTSRAAAKADSREARQLGLDGEIIEEPTQKSYQQIAGDGTTDRAVGGDTAPDDQINGFLWGFSKGANIDRSEAPAQWAGHSIQLSDSERQAIERQGEDAGFTEGQQFAKLYRDTAPASPAHTPENSPEPWRCYNSDGPRTFKSWRILDKRSLCVAKLEQMPGGESEYANAARICASVNACAGMTDPEAEIKALRDACKAAFVYCLDDERYSETRTLQATLEEALKGATK